MERLSGHEEYEELSNEPAFSKMVKEWKAYRSTNLSPADIPALTARAEAAEAERDACKIEGFPAADVAHVVRCGKCINRFNWNNGCGVCRMIGQNMNGTDFCSYGERKETT